MPPRLPLTMGVVVVPYIAWPALADLLLATTSLTLSLLKIAALLCHSLMWQAAVLLPLGLALASRRAALAF